MTRAKVYAAVDTERTHQDRKWGTIAEHPHEVGGWLTIMRQHLRDAEEAWAGNADDREALSEVRKIIAICVACAEQHGIQTRSKFEEPPTQSMRLQASLRNESSEVPRQ